MIERCECGNFVYLSSPPENPVPFRGWDEWQKPSKVCVDTARKIVTMMTEKPKSLAIFEETIIIDYCNSVVEVKDNVGEFLFLGKKK